MAYPTPETAVKVSSLSAESFVDWYYRDINDARPLSSYYVNASTKYTNAGISADITINGARLDGPESYEAMLDTQRGAAATPSSNNNNNNNNNGATTRSATRASNRVRYDVESFDVQVINDDYTLGAPEHVLNAGPDAKGGRISMLVMVMGTLHLGNGPDAVRKTFNEVFVLVPNWHARGRNAPRNAKKYLISSQNYRTL